MRDREFKLRLDIPTEFPKRSPYFFPSFCNNSDGLQDCECAKSPEQVDPHLCIFYGRPVEPLAFSLPSYADIDQQEQSPLYAVLPNEIRSLIWDFALADDCLPASGNTEKHEKVFRTKLYAAEVGSAFALLQTCKAVYLETYRLPILLNGYLAYRTNGLSCLSLEHLLPWQYALIQRLDLKLAQFKLQGPYFRDEIQMWKAALRHSGAYVSPRFYDSLPQRRPMGQIAAHNFALTLPSEGVSEMADGDKVTLRRKERVERVPEQNIYHRAVEDTFVARAMVARPLTHLTLRILYREWNMWHIDPTTDNDEQLGLDPARGGKEKQPLAPEMIALAAERREGTHPTYEGTWGSVIGTMSDLKTFELVLETYSLRKHELDTVVECAKTWKFPLDDVPYELVWDGSVGSKQWEKGETKQASLAQAEAERKNEIAGSSRQRSASLSPGQGPSLGAMDPQEPPTTPERFIGFSPAYSPSGSPPSPMINPVTPTSPGYSPTSPWYSPTTPEYSPAFPLTPFPNEPWLRKATQFEVRVVRFRRRRRVD